VARTYPVISKITAAEAAMIAAKFLNRKSPVNLDFILVKKNYKDEH